MMKLQEAYAPRPIRYLELWQPPGWSVKVYGIAYRESAPSALLVTAAKEVALARLAASADSGSHYGVGFMGVHEGRGANFIFIDWWANENELQHHVYVSTPDAPQSLQYAQPDGPIACVWDLAVLAYERTAWVETVLANPAGPDLAAYLQRRLDIDV